MVTRQLTRIREAAAAVGEAILPRTNALVLVAGIGMMSVGVFQVDERAGWIFLGAALVASVLMGVRR